jgi:hypothetical protein
MNHRSRMELSVPACMLVAVLSALSVQGQRDDVNKLAVLRARGETSLTVGRVRYDMVVAEYANAYLTDMTLLRTARETPDGWAARVYGPNGGLLMTGTFIDRNLRIPQGDFTFYHPNGNEESKGRFCNGGKVGLWQRWDQRGQPLSDRSYPDSCPVDTTGQHCWSTLSCTPSGPSR